jgi:hypothetical protein
MTGQSATPVPVFAQRRPRSAGRWVGPVAVVLAAVLLAGGCGDDNEAAGREQPSTTTTTSTPTTTTTQPPGTEPAAVEPIVEELLARDDEITDQILRDPSAALEPDSPLLEELAEVHAPGEAYEAMLRTFRRNAESGLRLEPLNAERTATTILAGDIVTIDDDTVEGPLCIVNTYRLLDGDGYLREVKDGLAHPGRVTAVRLDGAWKIQQIDVDDSQVCNPEATT